MKVKLLENLDREIGDRVSVRRYSLPEIISESYKVLYHCEDNSNMKKLAESHLNDLRTNSVDIETLSRRLSVLKELIKLTESGELKDEDLVDKKSHDTVEPNKDRVMIRKEECNESNTGALGAKVGDTIIDTKTGKEGKVQKVGTSGNYSILNVDFGDGRLRRINPMDDAQTTGRYSLKKESIKESDDADLTDEELEELAKHLETIRKERKNAPKQDIQEDATSKRRGIKCSMKDSKKPEKEINEAAKSYVAQYGVDILTDDNQADIQYKIEYALSKAGLKVLGVQSTDASWSTEEYEKLIGMSINDILGESKKEKIDDCNESTSYRGLKNFKKQSESKAFYKTFKKMHESLKEGKALTRQESIDLYKAANSALTQMSIELEHNPEFLKTFNESSTLLSADVNSLRESLARGKAPSKKTMKSLAKFSESLLCESTPAEDYMKDWAKMDHEKGKSIEDYDEWSKLCSSEGIEPSKKLYDLYLNHYNSLNETEKMKESGSGSWVQVNLRAKDEYKYCGNGGRSWVTADSDHIDRWVSREEAIEDGQESYNPNFKFGKSWDVVQLPESYSVNKSEGEDEDAEDIECQDLPPHIAVKCTAEKAHAKALANMEKRKAKKSVIKESDEDEEELDDIEASEEDFVGDDEGDVQSEEADAFDQEYADARVDLHKDLENKHANDEDPEVQEKLAQDAEEVVNLPGTTEEQIAELNGEESTEDSEDDDSEESEAEDDSEITDDELDELKSYLKEMRAAKKR